ncbi:hypothetical protein HDE_14041 [Halotydeus destructor]|nr:hypothetical protein HDE_14041 [Halotydeus destructor]
MSFKQFKADSASSRSHVIKDTGRQSSDDQRGMTKTELSNTPVKVGLRPIKPVAASQNAARSSKEFHSEAKSSDHTEKNVQAAKCNDITGDDDKAVYVPQVNTSIKLQVLTNSKFSIWFPNAEYLTGQTLLGPDLEAARAVLLRLGGNCGTCLGEPGEWFLGLIRPHTFDSLPVLNASGWAAAVQRTFPAWRPVSIFVPRSHLNTEFYRPYLFQIPTSSDYYCKTARTTSSDDQPSVWARFWYPPRLTQKVHKSFWGNIVPINEKNQIELVSVEKPPETTCDGQIGRPKSPEQFKASSSSNRYRISSPVKENRTLNKDSSIFSISKDKSLKSHLKRMSLQNSQ